ncbi:hypothetical protein [Paraurantiacibacter namhicola]|uniref:hypothetical protein n=1 Tax=Paraurantiacibacter namhicola TaxID=645517 RepID=UPI0014713DAD|nr:hypothetical protein [Paraurantiacibacter namhicola]
MNNPGAFVAGAITVLSILQIRAAVKTGKVGYLFGSARRTREGNPVLFWGTIAFWLAVIAICISRVLAL